MDHILNNKQARAMVLARTTTDKPFGFVYVPRYDPYYAGRVCVETYPSEAERAADPYLTLYRDNAIMGHGDIIEFNASAGKGGVDFFLASLRPARNRLR